MKLSDTFSAAKNVLYIKNMVCKRCIMVVREQLEQLGVVPLSVELGTVTLPQLLTDDMYRNIKNSLEPLGFELIDDHKTQLTEEIKNTIIQLVHHDNEHLKANFSSYLSGKFHREYSVLSKLFSETTGTTIEKYLIAQKIERVKELLAYNELSLNEIADQLNYSSAAYLSTQFKHITGMTPSHFKQTKEKIRKTLDEV